MLTSQSKQRKPWTQEEDQALVYLREEMKYIKWPEVARKMASQFKLEGRTQKQCRDRYVNFLRNADNSYQWKAEDEQKLTELYYQLGNKWSDIAIYFPHTNGIYIKNKFYSRLRKAIRYLNMVIESHFPEFEKRFSFDIIFKLVNNANQKYKFNENSDIRGILEADPKFFEDIIVKLIQITNSSTKKNLKNKKMHRVSLKDEAIWKKLIEILIFLEKQLDGFQNTEYSEKDLYLQTNHYEGIRNLGAFRILGFLGLMKNYPQEPMEIESRVIQSLIEASYIQLKDIEESMLKRKSQIIIISDQKRLCYKKREDLNPLIQNLSKKEETLSIKKTDSLFKRKEICDDKSLAAMGKDGFNPQSLSLQDFVTARP